MSDAEAFEVFKSLRWCLCKWAYNRFPKHNALFGKFFDVKNEAFLEQSLTSLFHFSEENDEDSGGDVVVDSGYYPILWTLATLDKSINDKDLNYPQFIFEDEEFARLADSFLSQLDISGNKNDLLKSFILLSYLLSEGRGQEEQLSDRIRNITVPASHHFAGYFLQQKLCCPFRKQLISCKKANL